MQPDRHALIRMLIELWHAPDTELARTAEIAAPDLLIHQHSEPRASAWSYLPCTRRRLYVECFMHANACTRRSCAFAINLRS